MVRIARCSSGLLLLYRPKRLSSCSMTWLSLRPFAFSSRCLSENEWYLTWMSPFVTSSL
jgi:hypothetical protein